MVYQRERFVYTEGTSPPTLSSPVAGQPGLPQAHRQAAARHPLKFNQTQKQDSWELCDVCIHLSGKRGQHECTSFPPPPRCPGFQIKGLSQAPAGAASFMKGRRQGRQDCRTVSLLHPWDGPFSLHR